MRTPPSFPPSLPAYLLRLSFLAPSCCSLTSFFCKPSLINTLQPNLTFPPSLSPSLPPSLSLVLLDPSRAIPHFLHPRRWFFKRLFR